MSEVNDLILELLNKHSIRNTPVNIFKVIKDEGIHLLIDDIEFDYSGFLLVESGKAAIVVNKRHHPNRQRFTAAHELGHYFLHAQEDDQLFIDKAYYRSPLSSAGTNFQEIEANQFAAALLIPEQFLVAQTKDLDLTDIDVSILAEEFEVSEQAMTLRLAKLELIDVF